MNLYKIRKDFCQFQAEIENEEVPEQAIADTLESLNHELTVKARNVGAVILNIKADIEALKNMINRLTARKQAYEARVEFMRDYLRENMLACGISKVKGPELSITISHNPALKVDIYNEDLIPEEFITTVVTKRINKTAIKECIQSGKEVPGAVLADGKHRLVIR